MIAKNLLRLIGKIGCSALTAGFFYIVWLALIGIPTIKSGVPILRAVGWISAPLITGMGFGLGLWLWESTMLNGSDGVQLNPLSDRTAQYLREGGKVAFRSLGCDKEKDDFGGWVELRPRSSEFEGVRHKLQGRPYERHLLELVKCAHDGPWGEAQDKHFSLFCSELFDLTCNELGLTHFANCSEATPSDHAIIAGWHDLLPCETMQ